VNESECGKEERFRVRLTSESPKAFLAFCMFRDMGYRRNIKSCMELHGIEKKHYSQWSRWARLFDWDARASLYDEYIAAETERELKAERVERKRRQIELLSKFDGLVEKRLGTLDPNDLNADDAMDLLERSAKLDGFLAGESDKKKDSGSGDGQLQLVFTQDFKDL